MCIRICFNRSRKKKIIPYKSGEYRFTNEIILLWYYGLKGAPSLQNGAITVENSMEVPQKITHGITI